MIQLGKKLALALVKLVGLLCLAIGALLGYDATKKLLYDFELEQMEIDYDSRASIVNPVISQVKSLVRPKYTPIIAIGTSKKYFCTAFVISANYALTASHCVKDLKGNNRKTVRIFATDMKTERVVKTTIDATVVSDYMYGGLDVAAINGDFKEFDRLATISNVQQIDNAQTISFGILGDKIVAQKLYLVQPYGFGILAAGQLFPGMSGGPVLDAATGRAIGVNSAMGGQGAIVSPLHEWKHYLNLKDAND